MSMKYNYLHSAGEGEQDRYLVCEKRLSEAWHMYTLIEQMQRYMISGPVSRGDTIELSLKHYLPLLNLEFSKKWSRHQCSKPGCGTCIIFDGGMKGIGVKITETEVTFFTAQRRICAARKSGVRIFPSSKSCITTGKIS